MTSFDPSMAQKRIDQFWELNAEFGLEHSSVHVYLSEIVSDRYVLVNGLQLIHDELQLAGLGTSDDEGDDVVACGADLSLPSVMTTLAHTNCGDRIHQGEATTSYEQIVAQRFACMSEIGEYKLEAFSPTGGGSLEDTDTYKTAVGRPATTPRYAGALRIAPGRPEDSLVVQLATLRGQGQMPPIGSHVVDENGAALLRAWIGELSGAPDAGAPTDASTADDAGDGGEGGR